MDIWEKCTRCMLLWNEDELESFLHIILTLGGNIVSHPDEIKYHRLKFSNRNVREKINARTGGADFMQAMGFEVKDEDNNGNIERMFVLRPEEVRNVPSGLDWLSETVEVCKKLIAKKGKGPKTYAATCLVQIKLPHGGSVQGGFMTRDTIRDVKSFVQHFFVEERQEQVILHLPHEASIPLDPDFTMSELKLIPRCLLVASTMSSEDRVSSLKQAHVQAVSHEDEKIIYKQNVRQTKKLEQEQRRKEKADILRAFKEDHDIADDSDS